MRKLFSAAFAAVCLLATSAAAQTEGAGVNPGTAAHRSSLQGCVYRAAPVTALDGQQLAANCDANGRIGVSSGVFAPLGYQQITSLSAATALTIPAGATVAVIQAETQAVRWRDDGTNPTASVGQPLTTGVLFTYRGNLTAIKFIEQTASAKLNVSYY